MGKVLEKLAKLPAVKSLNETSEGITIILTDGRESTVKTAHAARLFIQGGNTSTTRTSGDGENDNANIVAVKPLIEEIRVPKYPGMAKAAYRDGEDYTPIAIWDRPKGFQPNSAEGQDAFRRGYDRKSHYYGESSAAKEFEQAWDAAKRDAELKKDTITG